MTTSASNQHVLLLRSINDERALGLTQELNKLDLTVSVTENGVSDLYGNIQECDPDTLILELDLLDDQIIGQLKHIQQDMPLPIVVLARQDTPNLVSAIIETGIGAYAVEEVKAPRLETILNLARARFLNWRNMNQQLAQAKEKLSERKLIERAKGVLMQEKSLSEEEAYSQMRKTAMDKGVPMSQLAKQILIVFKMLDS